MQAALSLVWQGASFDAAGGFIRDVGLVGQQVAQALADVGGD